jgi:hypothetical protein
MERLIELTKSSMRTANELTQNELQGLRSRWYNQHKDDGSLNEVMDVEDDVELSEEDIPMDVVIAYYDGTLFSEEDFSLILD